MNVLLLRKGPSRQHFRVRVLDEMQPLIATGKDIFESQH